VSMLLSRALLFLTDCTSLTSIGACRLDELWCRTGWGLVQRGRLLNRRWANFVPTNDRRHASKPRNEHIGSKRLSQGLCRKQAPAFVERCISPDVLMPSA
jgi:hypothetical protein